MERLANAIKKAVSKADFLVTAHEQPVHEPWISTERTPAYLMGQK